MFSPGSSQLDGIVYYDGRLMVKRVMGAVDEAMEGITDNDKAAVLLPWSYDYNAQQVNDMNRVVVLLFGLQGPRPSMEDAHLTVLDLNTLFGLQGYPPQAFFGVFDGHSGLVEMMREGSDAY